MNKADAKEAVSLAGLTVARDLRFNLLIRSMLRKLSKNLASKWF